LRFSLDRFFPRIDTANPDSGDRGKRQTDPVEDDGVRSNHETDPGFRNTIQREVTAPRLVSAKWQTCYEACLWYLADGRSCSFADGSLSPLTLCCKRMRTRRLRTNIESWNF